MPTRVQIFIALASSMLAAGCVSKADSVSADIDPDGWGNDHVAQIIFDNTDTLSERNIDFFILCNGEVFVERESLKVTVTISSPDSLHTEETLLFRPPAVEPAVADPTEIGTAHTGSTGIDSDSADTNSYITCAGNPVYSGFRQISLPCLRGAVMGKSGKYEFAFSLDSPTPVRGIKAIGVEIRDGR